jgi:hypothetical protein
VRKVALALSLLLVIAACTTDDDALDARPDPVTSRSAPAEEDKLPCNDLDAGLRRVKRGWVRVRGQDISLLPREPNYIGADAKPVHTGPWDYLAEVPLVFYGPGQIPKRGSIDSDATLADLAPTYAAILRTDDFETSDGRVLEEVVDPSASPPRLIVTVVWDGGGNNVLREHEGQWPFLEQLMSSGVSFTKAEIGSTPSNTPPIHTTIGTGVFPREHGIPAVKMETASGAYIDPYEGNNADRVRVPTFADAYDKAGGNDPLIGLVATVNWHLGMIGHGAHYPGGDHDIALLLDAAGEPYGDTTAYEIPSPSGASLAEETRVLDAEDGAIDDHWVDRDLTDPALRNATPAFVNYQEGVLEALVADRGFGADDVSDLLYTNFKSVDDSGHRWGMTSGETGEVVAAADAALRSLVGALDRSVGKAKWVLVMTADHGFTRFPRESGGWPIGGGELKDDANRVFDKTDDDVELVTRVTSAGAFIDNDQLEANTVTMAEIGEWMAGYTVEENVRAGADLPDGWQDRASEPLFDAAVVGRGQTFVTCSR